MKWNIKAAKVIGQVGGGVVGIVGGIVKGASEAISEGKDLSDAIKHIDATIDEIGEKAVKKGGEFGEKHLGEAVQAAGLIVGGMLLTKGSNSAQKAIGAALTGVVAKDANLNLDGWAITSEEEAKALLGAPTVSKMFTKKIYNKKA